MFDLRTPISLYPFQKDAVTSSERFNYEMRPRHILQIPTGGGKTIVALTLIDRVIQEGGRALFIVPRKDLAKQTVNTGLTHFFLPQEIGRVQADYNEVGRSVTVATVQTLSDPQRLEQLLKAQKGRKFDIVISDECHYAISPSWEHVIEQTLSPQGRHVGASATPYRADNVTLAGAFPDGICYTIDFTDLILGKFLVDVESYDVPTDANLKGLSLDEKSDALQLAEVLHHSNRYQQAYEAWMSLSRGMRTLFFGQDLPDCYLFQKYFTSKGVGCAVVRGSTDDDIREECYTQLAAGNLPIVAGYNVLTTGLDIREIECIIMGRATNSRGLFIQAVGRGLRTAPGKEKLILLNLTDKDHTLMTVNTLIGVPKTAKVQSVRHVLEEKMKERQDAVVGDVTFVERLRDIHVYASSVFAGKGWNQDRYSGDYVRTDGDIYLRAERSFDGYHVTAYKRKVTQAGHEAFSTPERITESPLPAEFAMAKGHQYLEQRKLAQEARGERREAHQALLSGVSPHLNEKVTPSQLSYLIEKRRMHFKDDPKEMLQRDYAIICAHLDKHKSAHGNGWHVSWNKQRGAYSWPDTPTKKEESDRTGKGKGEKKIKKER